MLQAGEAEFQSLLLLLFNGIWESHVQPTDWQLSLMQPIYKGREMKCTVRASKHHCSQTFSTHLGGLEGRSPVRRCGAQPRIFFLTFNIWRPWSLKTEIEKKEKKERKM